MCFTATLMLVQSCFPTGVTVDQGDQELGDTAVVIASLAAAARLLVCAPPPVCHLGTRRAWMQLCCPTAPAFGRATADQDSVVSVSDAGGCCSGCAGGIAVRRTGPFLGIKIEVPINDAASCAPEPVGIFRPVPSASLPALAMVGHQTSGHEIIVVHVAQR